MKKFVAVLLCMCLLSGCAMPEKKDKKDKDRDEDRQETSEVEEEEEETEAVLETGWAPDLEVPEEETVPSETEVEINYDYESYYIDTINEYLEENPDRRSEYGFNLIYINDDDIPELVIDLFGYYVSVYTYADGEVYCLMDRWGYGVMGNAGYEYIPRGNTVYNSNSDYAGALRWETYMYIENNTLVVSDDELYYQYFPEGSDPWDYGNYNPDTVYYFVNGEEVSEEVYNTYGVVGDYRFIMGDYTEEEIMEFLTTETTPKTSYYTIVMADCTWEEAAAMCEAAGGHLATLDESNAYSVIYQAIIHSDNPNAVLYIGGSYDSSSGEYLWTADGSNEVVNGSYWRPGEPTYTGGTEDGRTVDEPYMCIAPYIQDGYTTYGFMDIPNDTIDAAPTYAGNVGYILEIER